MAHHNPQPTPKPLRAANRMASFRHAFAGIALLVRSQANARIHLAATVAVVATGLWLKLPARDWALLTLAMGGVWAAEALNTAIETVVNLASPQWHSLARDAKDLAAGAVLLTTFAAVVVGMLVLAPVIVQKLG